MLNRCAVIVRPAQPFIDWVASLDDGGVLPDPQGEHTVYLFSDLADGGDIDEMIAEAFDVIFENELDGWHNDEAAWPKPRTLAVFKQWFKVEVHSVIHDLGSDPLIDDEYE